ncbi:MAG: RsmE family RNA methyltransferase [Bacilli bacterium]|jgi:16S rRNA (uracil1498-N3)-methyltransferase
MPRYFALDENLTLSKEDIHHIVKVRRMKMGDLITIVYNKEVYLCQLKDIMKNHLELLVIKKEQEEELDLKITIGMALLKESKFDLVLQKGTELGATAFLPLKTVRSIDISFDKKSKKRERWSRICQEASKQSKRINVPLVFPIINLTEINEKEYDLKILCSLQEKELNIKQLLQKSKNYDKIIVIIGPEGGLTKEEEQILVDKGFIKVSLGSRVLRTETTPIFILSILNYEFMR